MKKQTNWIIFDGNITKAEEPVVPVSSRGLTYGDGAFETFRTYDLKTFLLQKHLQRLHKALQVLNIAPPDDITLQKVESLTLRLLQKNQLQRTSAIVRLQVWREGTRGYYPSEETNSHYSLLVSACPDSFNPPTLVTTDIKRIPSESLPSRYKFTNGINYILAAQEAKNRDADDALMETVDGYVAESTIANIFWIKNRTVFTPSVKCDLLPGITRQIVVNLLKNHKKLEVMEGEFVLEDLLKADGVWLSNSVREILPVDKVNDVRFDTDNPHVHLLKKDFVTFRNKKLKVLAG